MFGAVQLEAGANSKMLALEDFLKRFVPATAYGAAAGVTSNDLAVALALAFADHDTVFVSNGTFYVKTNYTIPAGKFLVALPGGIVSADSGVTLTCTGTFVRFVTAQAAGAGTISGAGKLLITTTNA